MSKKLIALSLALVMLLALCLSGCASNNANNGGNGGNGGSEDGDGGATKDTLVIAHQVDCGDMNPHGLTSFDYWKIKAQCYEPLFRLDFETNEIIPLLATGYEWIDNQTLQINLREGVQFHNGYGEMTAEDVMFSLETVYNSAASYPIAELDIDNCEIVDDYTIILRTVQPYSPLVNNLSNCATSIFSKAGYEEDNGAFTKDIGTGPFVFDEWLEGESVTQVRFDDYWGEAAKIPNLLWRVIDSETSRSIELQTGGCDLAYTVSVLDRDTLEGEGYVFESFWTNDTNVLVFNCELPMFQDTTLRRAFAYAVDKAKLSETGTFDASRATDLVLDYNHPYAFESVEEVQEAGGEIITFDLEKARELFEEAGYFDPNSDIYNYNFTLEVSPGTSYEGWSQAFKSDLASIGVNVEIVSYDWATYVNDLKVSRDFELCAWGTAPVTGDFDYFALHYYSDSTASINIPQCKDPEFDALVDQYRLTTDPAEQEEIAKQAQLILYEQYYQVPLYETVSTYAHSSNLKGFAEGMYQSPILSTCYFE